MRERFRLSGFDDFKPHEMLELLLFFSNRRVNTNRTAHRLLERYGTLWDVLRADREDLMQTKGIGPRSADLICSVRKRAEAALTRQLRSAVPLTRERCVIAAFGFMEDAAPCDAGLFLLGREGNWDGFRLLRNAAASNPEDLAGRIAAEGKRIVLLTRMKRDRDDVLRLEEALKARDVRLEAAYYLDRNSLEPMVRDDRTEGEDDE